MKMYSEDCEHNILDRNLVCVDCGLCTDDGTRFDEKPTGENSSTIVAMLRSLDYPLPTEVIDFVVLHAKKSDRKCQRKRFNMKELYAYIYVGYVNSQIPFDPNDLSDAIGLTKVEKAQAIKLVSGFVRSGLQFSIPVCVMHPSDYMSISFDRLKCFYSFSESEKTNLMTYTDDLVRFDPLLLNEKHSGIAAGVFRVFFVQHGIDHTRLENSFGITSSYLKTITARVTDTMTKMEKVAQAQRDRKMA